MRWENDKLEYKKFTKDDLIGSQMTSIFTNTSGNAIFEQTWGYLVT